MTRWKREPTSALVLMHAHNQWSRWYDHLCQAADALGLLVGVRRYANGSGDGSTDTEWFVLDAQLERVGGMVAVRDRAHELQEQAWVEQREIERSWGLS